MKKETFAPPYSGGVHAKAYVVEAERGVDP